MQRLRLMSWISVLALAACDGEVVDPEQPEPPSVDDIDSPTREIEITVSGEALPDARIDVTGGDAAVDGMADGDGAFVLTVRLVADELNMLEVTQTVEGVTSDPTTVAVTHDGTGPDTPSVDPVVSPTRRTSQTLRGNTEPNARVIIRGGAVEATGDADGTGRYSIPVMLMTVEAPDTIDNEISVVALDELGNESEPADVTITFDPSIPLEAPSLDDYPAATNEPMVTLTGEAEAGAEIQVSGGAMETEATVGEDNRFTVDVALRPNQQNTLLLFAMAGAETSVGATAVITHDDIAPEPPTLHPTATPTGAEILRLGGNAEPNTTVVVTGGAEDAEGTVDDTGAFVVDVELNADAENTLSVTVVDAATNESPAVELLIEHDSELDDPITVAPVASPTSEATVTIMGTGAPMEDVEVTGGAATAMATTDEEGAFMVDVSLTPNARNELRVTHPGSGVDTIVIVVHDDVAPTAPTLNTIASPTSNTTVIVSGTSEALARIHVTGGVMAASRNAGSDGRFEVAVQIPMSTTTTLSVVAADLAGNTSAPASVMVTHSTDVPAPPIVDTPNPAPTNVAMHTITGHVAEPGAGITVRVLRDGSEIATGATNATSGTFSIEVPLALNTVNSLSVVSRDGTIDSSPTIVTITHDNIAPAAPVMGNITGTPDMGALGACPRGLVGTQGSVSGIMGSVENNARVQVANQNSSRSGTAMTTADSLGAFSINLTQCNGDIIRITATDAAGNVSAATDITTGS
jgi:hypothetical protein